MTGTDESKARIGAGQVADWKSGGRDVGIPWVWVTGGALVTVLVMIIGLLGYILSMGAAALWPGDILQFSAATEGYARVGVFQRTLNDLSRVSEEANLESPHQGLPRNLIYKANLDFGGREFIYVTDIELENAQRPSDVWYIERREWGPFIGYVKDLELPQIIQMIKEAEDRVAAMKLLEESVIRPLNREVEVIRIEQRKLKRLSLSGKGSDSLVAEQDALERRAAELKQSYDDAAAELRRLQSDDEAFKLRIADLNGTEKEVSASQVVRAFQPNSLGFFGKIRIYLSRVFAFISEEPREANTQGGVFPALFGTVVMTLIMTAAVLPAGVMAAIYMREIAKQGLIVSFVRIAVGNLAGVPSIVYGIFGLGFFCYTLGSSIDQIFYVDRLPSPTFGTGGILWASLTLALLTLPVVIVSTEEALQAVPRSLREASYGCGATRLQTLVRVVIPRAMPGVMTGVILAMARGMGEVAPLLVTGVVKLAPELPLDGEFPFFHLERSFMHLGFHIYDVGFQSRSAEVSRPMVFASTGLLVTLVFLLNLIATRIRSKLRKRFEGRGAF